MDEIISIGVLIFAVTLLVLNKWKEKTLKKYEVVLEERKNNLQIIAIAAAKESVAKEIETARKIHQAIQQERDKAHAINQETNLVVNSTRERTRLNVETTIRYHEKLQDLCVHLIQMPSMPVPEQKQLDVFLQQLEAQKESLEGYYFVLCGRHFTFEFDLRKFKDNGPN